MTPDNSTSLFFEQLESLKNRTFFFTNDTSLLNKETQENCSCVPLTNELTKKIDKKEILTFFESLISKIKAQLEQASLEASLLFYVWYDEQAGQLRYSAINSKHNDLPFKSQVKLTSLKKIIDQAYNSISINEIPKSMTQIYNSKRESDDESYTLNVYKILIAKN